MKNCSYIQPGYVLFAIIYFLAGCGGGSSDDGTTTYADPSISSFVSSDATVVVGESASLMSVFSNGTGIVSNGVGAVTSGVGVVVTPATTTTYILTVTNSSGVSVNAQATVTSIVPEPNNAPVASGDAHVTTEGKLLDTELTNEEAEAVVNFTVVRNQPEILDCSDPKSQPQIDDDFDSYNIGQNLDTQSPFWVYACEHFSNDDHSVVCDHGGTETGDNIIGDAACSDGITNGAGCSTYTAESYSFLKVCAKLDVAEVTNEYSALLIVDAAEGGDENDDGYYLDLRLPGRLALRTKPTDAVLAANDSVNYGEGDMVCLAFWENAGTLTLTGTLNGAVAVEATDGLVFRGPFYATVFISRDQSDLTLVNGFDDFGVAECGTNVY